MRFSPKSAEELENDVLLEEGIYDFQVALASNEISQKGNEMLKLSLQIWDKEGRIHCIFDFLVEAMAYKLRHFCEATGLMQKYESGDLNPNDCINKRGKVEIIIKEGNIKNDGSRYRNSNAVKDYIVTSQNSNKEALIEDCDIPF